MRALLIQWLGWFAEHERDELAARTRASLDRIKENIATTGVHVSRAGRRITRLGRPGHAATVKRQAIEMSPGLTLPELQATILASGGPRVGLATLGDWTRPPRRAERAA